MYHFRLTNDVFILSDNFIACLQRHPTTLHHRKLPDNHNNICLPRTAATLQMIAIRWS